MRGKYLGGICLVGIGLMACGKVPIAPVNPVPEHSHPSEPIQPDDPDGPKSPITKLQGQVFILDTSNPKKPLARHWCHRDSQNVTFNMTTGDPKKPIKLVAKGKISDEGELEVPLKAPAVSTFNAEALNVPMPNDMIPKELQSNGFALKCTQNIKASDPKLKFAMGLVTTDDGKPLLPFQNENDMYDTVAQPNGINFITYADRASSLTGTSECVLEMAGMKATVRGVYKVDLVKGWNIWRAEIKYVDNLTREFHFKNANKPEVWLEADLMKYWK